MPRVATVAQGPIQKFGSSRSERGRGGGTARGRGNSTPIAAVSGWLIELGNQRDGDAVRGGVGGEGTTGWEKQPAKGMQPQGEGKGMQEGMRQRGLDECRGAEKKEGWSREGRMRRRGERRRGRGSLERRRWRETDGERERERFRRRGCGKDKRRRREKKSNAIDGEGRGCSRVRGPEIALRKKKNQERREINAMKGEECNGGAIKGEMRGEIKRVQWGCKDAIKRE